MVDQRVPRSITVVSDDGGHGVRHVGEGRDPLPDLADPIHRVRLHGHEQVELAGEDVAPHDLGDRGELGEHLAAAHAVDPVDEEHGGDPPGVAVGVPADQRVPLDHAVALHPLDALAHGVAREMHAGRQRDERDAGILGELGEDAPIDLVETVSDHGGLLVVAGPTLTPPSCVQY